MPKQQKHDAMLHMQWECGILLLTEAAKFWRFPQLQVFFILAYECSSKAIICIYILHTFCKYLGKNNIKYQPCQNTQIGC